MVSLSTKKIKIMFYENYMVSHYMFNRKAKCWTHTKKRVHFDIQRQSI